MKKINKKPLIGPKGQHIGNIDLSRLTLEDIKAIYAANYCIVTTVVKEKLTKH